MGLEVMYNTKKLVLNTHDLNRGIMNLLLLQGSRQWSAII